MSQAIIHSGSCLCGSVHVSADNASNKVGACHCGYV